MTGKALRKETRKTVVSITVPTFGGVQNKDETIRNLCHIQEGVQVSCPKQPSDISQQQDQDKIMLNTQTKWAIKLSYEEFQIPLFNLITVVLFNFLIDFSLLEKQTKRERNTAKSFCLPVLVQFGSVYTLVFY